MSARLSVAVQNEDFDLRHEHQQLVQRDHGVGAVVAFIGMVRDLNLADDVVALELEHYPGMTERSIHAMIDEAARRFDLRGVRIVHRVGHLALGEQIVLVAVASGHRADAFAACEFIMDYLKTRAPFWKKERSGKGARWVDARAADDAAAERWQR